MTILLSDPRVSAVPVREDGQQLVRLDERFGPARVLVREALAERLDRAERSLRSSGRSLRVTSGHRAPAEQLAIIAWYEGRLREQHPGIGPAELRELSSRFVSPIEVAPHVAGAAVDLTVQQDGVDLDMGTRIGATPEQCGGRGAFAAPGIGAAARRNRAALAGLLAPLGFANYPTEWWHWSLGDRYWALATGARAAWFGPAEAPVLLAA